jgi:hypothetical protein
MTVNAIAVDMLKELLIDTLGVGQLNYHDVLTGCFDIVVDSVVLNTSGRRDEGPLNTEECRYLQIQLLFR